MSIIDNSYRQNIGTGDLGVVALFSDLPAISRKCVAHVIAMGSYVKMARVDAWPVVAFMKNKFPFRYLSTMHNPRCAMSQDHRAIVSTGANPSIPTDFGAMPDPTSIYRFNVREKPSFECANHG